MAVNIEMNDPWGLFKDRSKELARIPKVSVGSPMEERPMDQPLLKREFDRANVWQTPGWYDLPDWLRTEILARSRDGGM